MEIRVLKYFLSIAREQNISVAANYLHVTQPTLSRQIKDLEEELGQKLFIRGSHNVTLTDEGMIFRKRAEQIIDMVTKTEEEFFSMGKSIRGDICIGTAESYNFRVIAEVIKKVQKKYPNIHYHLYSGNEQDITELLDKGLIDFGILADPSDITKYDYFNLPNEDIWGLVMRKNSPLAKKEYITKKDVLKLPLICSRQAISKNNKHNNFIEWFGEDFDKLNIIGTSDLFYNVSILVDEEIGYAITFDKMINTSEYKNLTFRALYPKINSKLNIVWKKQMIFSKPSKVFFEELNNHLK